MTVKELKEIIKDVPDDVEVVSRDSEFGYLIAESDGEIQWFKRKKEIYELEKIELSEKEGFPGLLIY